MLKKKFHWVWISMLVLILLGSQLLAPASSLIHADGTRAQASENQDLSIYLPLAIKEFPPPATAFGIDLGAIVPNNGLNQMVQAGTYWVRRDGVDWKAVEPNKGDRNWGALAILVTDIINAQRKGLEPIVIVSGTPSWARKYPDYGCGPIKSSEFGAFADFMKDLVARYSVAPYNVKYWEIWNEPDASYLGMSAEPDSRFGCWGEPSDTYFGGEYYGEMLKVVTPQIKLADPETKVIVGGLLLDCDPAAPPSGRTCAESRFLEGILRAGGGDYLDGVSIHAYDYYSGSLGAFSNPNWQSAWNTTGPVVTAKVNHIRNILNHPDFGAPGKFIMNTEAALVCGSPADLPGTGMCDSNPASAFELTKADYVAKVFAVDQSLGLLSSIWYNVFGWRNSGLLNTDLTTRPAYTAYAVAQDAIGGADFDGKVDQYAGVEGFKFSRVNKIVWVLWSKDGQNHAVDLGSMPFAVYDALGQASTPSQTITVGLKPLYVEWNK